VRFDIAVNSHTEDVKQAAAAWAFGTTLIAAIVGCLLVGGGQADDDDARTLLQGLQSADCEARSAAVATYLRSTDNRKEQNAGVRSLRISDAELRERISSLTSILADEREGVARISALADEISRLDSLRPSEQQLQLRQYRHALLTLIRNPDERLTARVGAPWILTRVLRAGEKNNPDWIPEWRKQSLGMLRGGDDALRIVAAINAALGRLPEGSDPRTSEIAQALMGGLQHDSAVIRSMSIGGLNQITRSGPCFEPTDSAGLRATTVRDWDAWWKQNKADLESRRIKQAFW